MRRQAPVICPVCEKPLRIARLECDACKTAIEGDFDRGRLGRLSRDQIAFVEVFLECRGKIKDVEERLGISYPTVVSRLDQIVDAMGSPVVPTAGAASAARGETKLDGILESLAKGDLSPTQAAERLRAMRGKNRP